MKIQDKLVEMMDRRIRWTVELVPLSDYELNDGWVGPIVGLTDIPAAPGWVWIVKS